MNQTINMFLIRRKSDEMFYGSREVWTKHIAKARPFKTPGGAKSSRGWGGWKTVMTPDICIACMGAKYRNWSHLYSERYLRPRWRGVKAISKEERLQQWITRSGGRKPCWHTTRMTDKENPLEVVKIQMTLTET